MSLTGLFRFFISRTAHNASAKNTVNVRRVKLYFQRSPGVPPVGFRGIEKLEYKVFWNNREVQSGQTSKKKDGKVAVMISPTAGTKTYLEILGTRYEIKWIKDLAKLKTIRGIQQRLAILGYYSGRLHGNETLATADKDLYDNHNVETERALLNFQADRGLFADALCGPKTQKTLKDRVKKATKVRVAGTNPSFYQQNMATLQAGDPRIVKLVHKSMRIVPVRFARAPHATDPNQDSGAPDANAPDPDDRGWARCVKSNHRAHVLPVGFDEEKSQKQPPEPQAETRVRLIRENIADAAGLYVTSSDAARVEVTSPTRTVTRGGTQTTQNKLVPQTNMMIKFRALKTGRCFLEVRYGAQDGPIIHRLQVVISAVKTLQVKAHAPVINSPTTITDTNGTVAAQSAYNTLAKIKAKFDEVNAVYFPYGIRFNVMSTVDTSTLNFARRGCVDLKDRWNNTANRWDSEFNTATAHNREGHGAINVFFVRQIIELNDARTGFETGGGADSTGGVASSARGSPRTFGLFLADWSCKAQTIAHELGHILHLVNDPKTASGTSKTVEFVHVNARDNRRNPAVPGSGVDVRDDIISRRRLMWAWTEILTQTLREFHPLPYTTPLPADNYENIMAYRRNVGYGNNQVGVMLAVKQYDKDRTDREMQEVQKSAKWLLSRP